MFVILLLKKIKKKYYNSCYVNDIYCYNIIRDFTAEEIEAKYQRILISSLHGYSVYLKKVPIQEIEKMIEVHNKIISTNKFWNLIKTDAIPIKTAFFTVLTSMIENADIILQNEKKRTVTSIINSLDETDPVLSSVVWEAMLATINKIKVNNIFTFIIIIYISVVSL